MPIDYSKFDNIGDSDDDAGSPAREATPSSRGAAGAGGQRRETLEPAGFDEKLRVVDPGSADLSSITGGLEQLLGGHPPAPQRGGRPGEPAGRAPGPEPPAPGEPRRLSVRADGRRKIHTTFPDGSETVEEFDEKTDVLLVRKTRRPTALGGEGEWAFEVGQAPEAPFDPHSHALRPCASNPIFLRKDTPESFQWRIRNLPYPANVYNVTVDHAKQEIVVRTSNKKYYKRIGVPDLGRAGLKLAAESLTWKYQHNTLIISYMKPVEVIEAELSVLRSV